MKQWNAIASVLEQLKECREIRAVFLKGSLALNEGDEYSDVDLYCLVETQELELFLAKRLSILESYRPLIFHTESNFVGPQIVAVYDNGLHFDLYTVTPDNFSPVGRVKPLYDPDGLLGALQQQELDHSLTWTQVMGHFNSFSFTLLEFHASWRRGDLLWSMRLASHLAGDLGVVLRHHYDPQNAMLGTKRLEQNLSECLKDKVRQAVTLGRGRDTLKGVVALCAIMEESMKELASVNKERVDWRLFNFMNLELSACKVVE